MIRFQVFRFRLYYVPLLLSVFLCLSTGTLLCAQDQDSPPPTAAAVDRYPWYQTIILEGRVISDPLFTGDGGMILISDDRRIQRIGTAGEVSAPDWTLRLPRLSAGEWFTSSGGGILIPAPERRMWSIDPRRGLVLDRSIRNPFQLMAPQQMDGGEGGDESSLFFRDIVQGRILEVITSGSVGEVSLYRWNPSGEGRGTRLLQWEISGEAGEVQSIHLHEARILIFQFPASLIWYSLDGRERARVQIPVDDSGGGWNTLFRMGDVYMLNNPDAGRYRMYDAAGTLLMEGKKQTGTPALMSWNIVSGGVGAQFSISRSSGALYAETEDGFRKKFFQLEDQWRFLRFFYSSGYFYAADNGWRIHRFHIQDMAKELYGLNIRPPAPRSVPDSSAGDFLSDLLVAALEFPERFNSQIASITQAMESGDLQGRLDTYSSALDTAIRAVYGSPAAASGGKTLPGTGENRSRLSAAVLQLGNPRMLSRLINALQYEVDPRVFSQLVERGDELMPLQKLELITLVREFIADAEPWQLSENVISGFARFLLNELEKDSGGGDMDAMVVQTAIPALNALYPYLENVQLRRRILGQTP